MNMFGGGDINVNINIKLYVKRFIKNNVEGLSQNGLILWLV